MLRRMKRPLHLRSILAAAALAALAAGCSSAPPGLDKSLESFTPLSVESRNVLAEEIEGPDAVVAALVDVDMRSDPRLTLLRYTPVRFRPSESGALNLHALAREEVFASMADLRKALRRRYAMGKAGIVVFFNGAAAGTPGRELSDGESAALAEVLAGRLQPMLEESKIEFAWIVPTSARLFPVLR